MFITPYRFLAVADFRPPAHNPICFFPSAYGYGRGMHYKLPDKRINILGANTTNSVYEVDKSGAYLGGITYRVKFENVKSGDTLTQSTKHFSKHSLLS